MGQQSQPVNHRNCARAPSNEQDAHFSPLHRPRLTRFSSVRASVQLIPVSALRCQGPVHPGFEWFIQTGHSVPRCFSASAFLQSPLPSRTTNHLHPRYAGLISWLRNFPQITGRVPLQPYGSQGPPRRTAPTLNSLQRPTARRSNFQ